LPLLINGKLALVFSFVEIFTQPARVFDRVCRQKIWVFPFVLVVFLLTLPTAMVIVSGGGIELLTLQRYENDEKLAEAVGGEDGIDRAVTSSNERWTKTLIMSRTAGAAAAGIVVLSLALVFAIGFLDARPDFFSTLGTVSYSIFPFALIGAIVTLLMLQLTLDHSGFELENMPALNLGRLLDRASSSPAVFSIAQGFDLLLAGEIILISFGLTRLSHLTYLQAFGICGGLWTVTVLWKAALAVYL
jgi:hypothetical protein